MPGRLERLTGYFGARDGTNQDREEDVKETLPHGPRFR